MAKILGGFTIYRFFPINQIVGLGISIDQKIAIVQLGIDTTSIRHRYDILFLGLPGFIQHRTNMHLCIWMNPFKIHIVFTLRQ